MKGKRAGYFPAVVALALEETDSVAVITMHNFEAKRRQECELCGVDVLNVEFVSVATVAKRREAPIADIIVIELMGIENLTLKAVSVMNEVTKDQMVWLCTNLYGEVLKPLGPVVPRGDVDG